MKENLVIVADLGLLRAYHEVQGEMDRQSHLELIEEFAPAAAREKLSDQLTDQAGRFPRGGGSDSVSGNLSAGERPGLEAEQSRRLIELLAEKIGGLLVDDNVSRCSLAVSAPIHKQLLDALDPKVRQKIKHVVAANLTKSNPAELLGHFRKKT